jgi:hypothetical protein
MPDGSPRVAPQPGRWIKEAEFASIHGLSRQTLCNWLYRDRKAGRTQAASGYPQYRYFGRAVRYWLPAELPEVRLSEKVSPGVSPVQYQPDV